MLRRKIDRELLVEIARCSLATKVVPQFATLLAEIVSARTELSTVALPDGHSQHLSDRLEQWLQLTRRPDDPLVTRSYRR